MILIIIWYPLFHPPLPLFFPTYLFFSKTQEESAAAKKPEGVEGAYFVPSTSPPGTSPPTRSPHLPSLRPPHATTPPVAAKPAVEKKRLSVEVDPGLSPSPCPFLILLLLLNHFLQKRVQVEVKFFLKQIFEGWRMLLILFPLLLSLDSSLSPKI